MIQIPISIGELFDKLSILYVKKKKITNSDKLEFVNKEYHLLLDIADEYISSEINNLYSELKSTNEFLWDIEDQLRQFEANKCFDTHFIDLARKVYYTNDKRFELKNQINELLTSEIREVKHYVNYK